MSIEPLEILLVEDNAGHAKLALRALSSWSRGCSVLHVGTIAEAQTAIAESPPDLALVDWKLPDGTAIELLNNEDPIWAYPTIVMTSHGNEQIAVAAMKAGAFDYATKSPEMFDDLPHIVERAMREWELSIDRKIAKIALESSERHFHAAAQSTYDAIITTDGQGRIVYWNPAA